MDALLKLLKKYKLPDPAADTEIGEFTNNACKPSITPSLPWANRAGLDALKVGGIIEETDMRDINAAIERSQKEVSTLSTRVCCADRAITSAALRRIS